MNFQTSFVNNVHLFLQHDFSAHAIFPIFTLANFWKQFLCRSLLSIVLRSMKARYHCAHGHASSLLIISKDSWWRSSVFTLIRHLNRPPLSCEGLNSMLGWWIVSTEADCARGAGCARPDLVRMTQRSGSVAGDCY